MRAKKQKTSSARSELFFMMRHLLRVALDNLFYGKNMVSNMAVPTCTSRWCLKADSRPPGQADSSLRHHVVFMPFSYHLIASISVNDF